MSGARGESARCPRTVTLPAESAAGPGGATPSRGRSGPLTRRRPPRRDPARPSEKKKIRRREAALSRESVAPRAGGGRRGRSPPSNASERGLARGSGLDLGLGLTRGGIARRDARRRLTEKPATRNAGGDDHRLEARRAKSIFTFVTRVKRDARVRPRLVARVGDAFEPAPRNATARITFTRHNHRSRPHCCSPHQCRSPPVTHTYLRSTERTQRLQ